MEFNPKERANAHGHHAEVLGSLLTFVAADGRVLSSFWISKLTVDADGRGSADVFTKDTRYPQRQAWPRYLGFTETGYVNDVMFERCIHAFCKEWKQNRRTDQLWLFGDQLGSHTRVNLARAALDLGVAMWLLPSNTSHFLQPLDEKIFALFKTTIASGAYDLSLAASFSNVQRQQLWWALAYQAETDVFTQRVIQSAFRTTGLFPWDPARIMSRAELNAGKIAKMDGPIKRDVVDAAVTIIKSLADRAEQLARKTKGYTVSVVANELHSPYRRIAYDDELRERNEAKRIEKELKVQEKLAQKEEKKAARAARKCFDDACPRVSRGGKSWSSCPSCSCMCCPQHRASLAAHVCVPVV